MLTGKVAFVTGGSRGIGAAIVQRLAAEGAAVAFTYVNAADRAAAVVDAVTGAGGAALAIQADNGDAAAVRNAVETAAAQFGRIDIVVNNAAITRPGPFEQVSDDYFQAAVQTSLRGAFSATQEALKHMADGGRIIMIGSSMSERAAFAQSTVYTMVKGGIAAMVRGLARDLGDRGITVNAILPGVIDTEMMPEDGEMTPMILPMLAIKRFGRTEEVAALAAFLAGPEASYITGSRIVIDGGISA